MILSEILDHLPSFRESLTNLQETILANLVMAGEIPSPTFQEEQRIKFLCDRFSECGLQNCSTDEKGNGLGILPGNNPDKNILLVAHADTAFPSQTDHTITVQTDKVTGPGVCDNSISVAVLASLPTILDHLSIQLDSNLVLIGSARGLGRGDLEGLRFFLANNNMSLTSGICLEGVQLGRLSYNSLGMIRGEISCIVPEEYDWTQFGASGAILTLTDVIEKINKIELPRRPRSTILFSSIHGGGAYFNKLATRAHLRFEIRSESNEIVNGIEQQLNDIIDEMVYQSGVVLTLDTFARRHPGGIAYRHSMVKSARDIMSSLDIQPWITPSISELSAFIDHGIPAITIGITKGENLGEMNESVLIKPVFTGITQLLGVLLAIDGENEHE